MRRSSALTLAASLLAAGLLATGLLAVAALIPWDRATDGPNRDEPATEEPTLTDDTLQDELIDLVPDESAWEVEVAEQRTAEQRTADRRRSIVERGRSSPLTPTDGEDVYVSTAIDGPSPLGGIKVRFTVRSEDGLIRVLADCNSIGGLHEIRDEQMIVHEMELTAADCGPERSQQDGWLMAFLDGRPAVTIEDDAFTLTDGTSTMTFTAEDTP